MIKFAISSTTAYAPSTHPVLLTAFERAGVPLQDVYLFTYNPEVETYTHVSGCRWDVPHNSMDFTGLISVLDLGIISDWWFLMHDTTYVGESFYKNLLSIDLQKPTMPLSKHGNHPGGSMGLYSQDFLLENKDKILGFKNTTNTEESVEELKTRLVHEEDKLFTNDRPPLNRNRPVVSPPIDFYENGIPRQIEHFEEIDLYKIKANWRGFVNKWVRTA